MERFPQHRLQSNPATQQSLFEKNPRVDMRRSKAQTQVYALEKCFASPSSTIPQAGPWPHQLITTTLRTPVSEDNDGSSEKNSPVTLAIAINAVANIIIIKVMDWIRCVGLMRSSKAALERRGNISFVFSTEISNSGRVINFLTEDSKNSPVAKQRPSNCARKPSFTKHCIQQAGPRSPMYRFQVCFVARALLSKTRLFPPDQ